MEAQEEVQIIKRKRTKRQRPPSPLVCSGGGSDVGGGSGASDNSGETIGFRESTKEEEDMANCLILLAQGDKTQKPPTPAVATTAAATGIHIHRCQTCHRCFPSFQALGGHRASHKKPRPTIEEKDQHSHQKGSIVLSLQVSTPTTSRVHECSICGAEFTSGQALGGHMRRHRAMARSTSPCVSQEDKNPRKFLSLDLNFPPPEDHNHLESKINFPSKAQVIVFSASPLIDCHY